MLMTFLLHEASQFLTRYVALEKAGVQSARVTIEDQKLFPVLLKATMRLLTLVTTCKKKYHNCLHPAFRAICYPARRFYPQANWKYIPQSMSMTTLITRTKAPMGFLRVCSRFLFNSKWKSDATRWSTLLEICWTFPVDANNVLTDLREVSGESSSCQTCMPGISTRLGKRWRVLLMLIF